MLGTEELEVVSHERRPFERDASLEFSPADALCWSRLFQQRKVLSALPLDEAKRKIRLGKQRQTLDLPSLLVFEIEPALVRAAERKVRVSSLGRRAADEPARMSLESVHCRGETVDPRVRLRSGEIPVRSAVNPVGISFAFALRLRHCIPGHGNVLDRSKLSRVTTLGESVDQRDERTVKARYSFQKEFHFS